MMSVFRGNRPDLTPAQVAGVLVAGIPVIVSLLRSFGVYDTDPAQEQALRDTVVWAGVLAGLLFASDAGLRAARNVADARRDAAASNAQSVQAVQAVQAASASAPGAALQVDADPTEQAIAAMLASGTGAVPDAPDDPR